jgi:GTPase SAR1 family protein
LCQPSPLVKVGKGQTEASVNMLLTFQCVGGQAHNTQSLTHFVFVFVSFDTTMGKYAQIVMGPAGCGKSTYCDIMRQHCENVRRAVHVVNLDPAAEHFQYPVSVDIRELISVDDVMSELQYGPNGGLMYCMEYVAQNLEWLRNQLGDFDDDYLLIDCPGQIELYTHVPVMKKIVDALRQWGYHLCAVYLIDAQFITDTAKFIAGMLLCLSAMVHLELPHVNVLSKMDLLGKRAEDPALDKFFDPSAEELVTELNTTTPKRFRQLNKQISSLLDDFNMVGFVPLNIKDPESISNLLYSVDNALQYGEDQDVNIPKDMDDATDDWIREFEAKDNSDDNNVRN